MVIWYFYIGLLFLWELGIVVNTENVVLLTPEIFYDKFGALLFFEAVGLNLIAPVGIYLLYKIQVKEIEKEI